MTQGCSRRPIRGRPTRSGTSSAWKRGSAPELAARPQRKPGTIPNKRLFRGGANRGKILSGGVRLRACCGRGEMTQEKQEKVWEPMKLTYVGDVGEIIQNAGGQGKTASAA